MAAMTGLLFCLSLTLAAIGPTCCNGFSFTVAGRTVHLSDLTVVKNEVATECQKENTEEYVISTNQEFLDLQEELKNTHYLDNFWLKVKQVPSGTNINYYWANEEIRKENWFHDSPTSYRDPNQLGGGCQSDPYCCIRLSTRWAIGQSYEKASYSGKHELTDYSCTKDSFRYFCIDQIIPPTTTEPTTAKPSTTEPTTTKPTTTEPTTTTAKPSTTEPTTTKPSTTEPTTTTTKPTTTEPTTTKPSTTEPTTTKPSTTEPTTTTTKPSTTEPTTTEIITTEPTTTKTTTTEPTTTDIITTERSTTKPTTTETTTTKPTTTELPTTIPESTTPGQASDLCRCNNLALTNVSVSDIEKVIQKTREYMAVHVPSLSATVRKLNSAEDNRPTSVAMGLSAIVFLGIAYGFIFISELIGIGAQIHERCIKHRG